MISEKIDLFLDAGQELNFSAVAKKNYTTQPTVSRQISDLEAEWGMQLFVRSNKGLRLTPEGAVMLDCCRKMNRLMDDALKKAGGIQSSKEDWIRLGFLSEINVDHLFMPSLADLSQKHPELNVSLYYGSFGDLRKGIEKDKLDIIFTYDFEIPNFKVDIVADHIRTVVPCFAISAEHPMYEKKDLTISNLKEELFFLPEEADSPGREKDMQFVLRASNISNANIRSVPNVETALLQARLGRGVAFVNSDAPGIDREALRVLPLNDKERYVQLSLVAIWKKDNLNPFIAAIMNNLKIQN